MWPLKYSAHHLSVHIIIVIFRTVSKMIDTLYKSCTTLYLAVHLKLCLFQGVVIYLASQELRTHMLKKKNAYKSSDWTDVILTHSALSLYWTRGIRHRMSDKYDLNSSNSFYGCTVYTVKITKPCTLPPMLTIMKCACHQWMQILLSTPLPCPYRKSECGCQSWPA